MIKRLIGDQEVEFKPAGHPIDPTAWLTATIRLFGARYTVDAAAVCYHSEDEIQMDSAFCDPFGTYEQRAADPHFQDVLADLSRGVPIGQRIETVKIEGREYVVFFTPFSA